MTSKRNLSLLGATAMCAAAFAAPGTAHAITTTCAASLDGPGDLKWQIHTDGSQSNSALLAGGSNFYVGHGQLKINGEAYPVIPPDSEVCERDQNTFVRFPLRNVGGFNMTREVQVVNGAARRIDTIYNLANVPKQIDVDFEVSVLNSQLIVGSETGDLVGTGLDHWTVHKTGGGSFPYLQWGESAADAEPGVFSAGSDPLKWEQEFNDMPDATLHYENLTIPANTTIRLMHVSGTSLSQDESTAAAKNVAAPLKGLTKEVAASIVNWGPDADKDGVSIANDVCPDVKGTGADGCMPVQQPPANPGDPQPPAGGGETPAGGTPGGGVAPVPGPGTGGTGESADRRAPALRLSGLPRSVRRALLTGKGLKPKVACDEACRLSVKVQVRRRGARKATTILQTRPSALSGARRAVRLKVGRKALRKLARQQISVVFVATDAAGNRKTVTKQVRLAG